MVSSGSCTQITPQITVYAATTVRILLLYVYNIFIVLIRNFSVLNIYIQSNLYMRGHLWDKKKHHLCDKEKVAL